MRVIQIVAIALLIACACEAYGFGVVTQNMAEFSDSDPNHIQSLLEQV